MDSPHSRPGTTCHEIFCLMIRLVSYPYNFLEDIDSMLDHPEGFRHIYRTLVFSTYAYLYSRTFASFCIFLSTLAQHGVSLTLNQTAYNAGTKFEVSV
jgi:hypothetical protein